MPLAIELFFDPPSELAIRSLWTALAAAGIRDDMATSQSRPHIALSVVGEMNATALQRTLARLSATHAPLSLSLSAQGRFPHSNLTFLAPKPSIPLLSLQQWLHHELVRAGAVVWPDYLPSAWVPHCTLTTRATPESATQLARITDAYALPAPVRLETVGLVRFQPVTHLQDYRLSA
jgi:2'-5' RNA ligase